MKKILIAALAFTLILPAAVADEGMWMLPLLEKMNAKSLKSLGCKLSPKEIYDINNSSLKDAVVQFGGGCTGEIISDQGLLVTNHHCGYGSIQKLSTPEHNYLEDGFWALTADQELPVPGLTVKFLQRMSDVSDVLEKAWNEVMDACRAAGMSDEEAVAKALEVREEARAGLKKQVEEANPDCTVEVVDFYNRNVAYLIVYKVFRDVRLVGTPPVSLGKFGGETDNWMWPRHTCDFSMFRVYASPDNRPADYSPENKPYRPRRSLQISIKGVQDGDFAMIMGYPGRTQRFQTADQLDAMMEQLDLAVKARTVRQKVMMEGMSADSGVRLKYASKYASSSNGWKKWQGEKLSFRKLDIIGREKRKEADFAKWVAQDQERTRKYGQALESVSKAVSGSREADLQKRLIAEALFNIGPVTNASVFKSVYQRTLRGSKDSTAALSEAVKQTSALFKDYDDALERKMAKAMIAFYLDNPAGDGKLVDVLSVSPVETLVDELFDSSIFASAQKLEASEAGGYSAFGDDVFMKIRDAVVERYIALSKATRQYEMTLAKGSKDFAGGLLEWNGPDAPSYPDANRTTRLTYGKVMSYSPKDGVLFHHYTTLDGVMEKEDPENYEFRVPEKLKTIYNTKDYGQYATKDGRLPVCFLTNCDITGGNSGSPVMNAKGQLIGLAFDGNWESMSSDVMFEPDLQRCICVDIRYVLLIVDKFGGAQRLIREMNIVK